MGVRFGNVPTPDGSWTPFTPVSVSGGAVSATSRYVQYQLGLSGTGPTTPVVEDVTIATALELPTISLGNVQVAEGNVGGDERGLHAAVVVGERRDRLGFVRNSPGVRQFWN